VDQPAVLLLTAQTNTRNGGQHRNPARIPNRSLVSSHGPLPSFSLSLAPPPPASLLAGVPLRFFFNENNNKQTICFLLHDIDAKATVNAVSDNAKILTSK
jgi:hypothetical protein